MNLVSVVIPSDNHADYVRLAVESVLGQTCANLDRLHKTSTILSDRAWMLLRFIESRYKGGEVFSEEMLLGNENLRAAFIRHVVP